MYHYMCIICVCVCVYVYVYVYVLLMIAENRLFNLIYNLAIRNKISFFSIQINIVHAYKMITKIIS